MAAILFSEATKAYPRTIAPAGKYPIVGDRIYATLQDAQDYVDGKSSSKTAIPGIYLSVIADGDNNGAYWVAQAAGYDGAEKGVLQKMGEGGGSSGGGGGEVTFSLASNTTNAVALTINGTTKNITAATLKSSLNVLGVSENAASATKLKDNTAFTIWGNTFFTNGKPANVSNHLYMGNGKAIYFADSAGTNRMLCQVNASNTALFGQGTASAGYDTYLNGHNVYIRTNYGNTIAMTLSNTGKVAIAKTSPSVHLDVGGQINSTNFPQGGTLSDDPTSSFQTTCFGSTSSLFRIKVMRPGNVDFDGVATRYGAFLAISSSDTHGYIHFPAYDSLRDKCYIGGGSVDALKWKATLFHNDMNLLPKADNTYSLGDSSKRWKEVHAVSIKIGDATITWDSSAGMLKADKGIYSTADIVAGK
jgi:hypothetical protein